MDSKKTHWNENILITHPHLANDWHYDKNSNIKPEDFTANSRRFVWWVCMSGHIWQDRINNRANGYGCPYDSGKRTPHSKTLADVQPALAAEWDYEGNDFLSPEYALAGSLLKLWWRCNQGHSFKARIPDRIKGFDCPTCAILKRDRIAKGKHGGKAHEFQKNAQDNNPKLPQ
jgi:uncharacterized C2H2 Zn-finger protein